MDFVKIINLPESLSIYDTPGIPLKDQVASYMEHPLHIYSTICKSKISPYNIVFKVGHSVWLGGVGRLDFYNGSDKEISICVPNQITIHRTNTNNAIELYERQKNKLLLPVYKPSSLFSDFVRHDILEKCTVKGKTSFDISIFGLGWISVQGDGNFNGGLHLHRGVQYRIRPPIAPFEIYDKGLKKLGGSTINLLKSKSLMGH